MPRCQSCGVFTKNPHREFDGRTERAYCDLCHAEREWKFGEGEGQELVVETPPPLTFWERLKRLFSPR